MAAADRDDFASVTLMSFRLQAQNIAQILPGLYVSVDGGAPTCLWTTPSGNVIVLALGTQEVREVAQALLSLVDGR